MLDLIAQWSQQPNLLLYICVAGAVMLAVETIGLSLRRIRSSRTTINKRLQLLGEDTNQGNVLVQLRRDRGLTEDGSFSFSFVLVNRLLVQSGVGTQSISFIVVVCTCIRFHQLILIEEGAELEHTTAKHHQERQDGGHLNHSRTTAVVPEPY